MSSTTLQEQTSTLAPFRNRIFRNIWLASLTSNIGTMIQVVAAAWIMTEISHSADMVALVQTSMALPIVLLSLASGAIADNFDRRRVMLVAQGVMLAATAALTVAIYAGAITPWLLLAFIFAVGCGTAIHNPSWQASVGDIVTRPHLPAAVALNAMGNNLARSIGPALGGVIVAAAGTISALSVNIATYLVLIVVLWRWKSPVTTSGLPREMLGPAVATGLRYVAMSPRIAKVLFRSLVFSFAATSVLALLPVIARDTLGGDALLYGLLFGAFGSGAVLGGIASGRLRRRFAPEVLARISFSTFAACTALLALSSNAWLSAVALVICGANWLITLSLFNISIQLSSPRWVVGRTLSIFQMAAFAGMASGSWVWGLVAERAGIDTSLLSASSVLVAGVLIGIGRLALPRTSEDDLAPLNRWREPRLALNITPRSGPVTITVEYVITEQNLADFLGLMGERGRIRRRDGARRWTLVRDIERPNHWIESYQFPTWADYVRLTQRVTQADSSIIDRIRKLHAAPEPPVRRCLIERPTTIHGAESHPRDVIDLH